MAPDVNLNLVRLFISSCAVGADSRQAAAAFRTAPFQSDRTFNCQINEGSVFYWTGGNSRRDSTPDFPSEQDVMDSWQKFGGVRGRQTVQRPLPERAPLFRMT